MSPTMEQSIRKFHASFLNQGLAAAKAITDVATVFPIACVALYGSVLTWVGPNSDVDILVLIRDSYKDAGFDFLDMKLDLEDIANSARVNDVPIDLHVSIANDFFDVSRDTAFKRSFSDKNFILWEDGETIEPYLVKLT